MKRPDRAEREAAALRANLLKRKDQARRRAAGEAPAEPEAPAHASPDQNSDSCEDPATAGSAGKAN